MIHRIYFDLDFSFLKTSTAPISTAHWHHCNIRALAKIEQLVRNDWRNCENALESLVGQFGIVHLDKSQRESFAHSSLDLEYPFMHNTSVSICDNSPFDLTGPRFVDMMSEVLGVTIRLIPLLHFEVFSSLGIRETPDLLDHFRPGFWCLLSRSSKCRLLLPEGFHCWTVDQICYRSSRHWHPSQISPRQISICSRQCNKDEVRLYEWP